MAERRYTVPGVGPGYAMEWTPDEPPALLLPAEYIDHAKGLVRRFDDMRAASDAYIRQAWSLDAVALLRAIARRT